MEGEEIISVSLKRSAQEVYDYLEDKSKYDDVLKCLEQEILSKKDATQVESFNPDMKVSLYYEHHRMGSFKTKYQTTLEDYLLIMTMDICFSYSDVLGKHSEIECSAREFEHEIGYEGQFSYLGDWREAAGLEDDDDVRKLEAFIADLCKLQGPCNVDDWEDKVYPMVKKCEEFYANKKIKI